MAEGVKVTESEPAFSSTPYPKICTAVLTTRKEEVRGCIIKSMKGSRPFCLSLNTKYFFKTYQKATFKQITNCVTRANWKPPGELGYPILNSHTGFGIFLNVHTMYSIVTNRNRTYAVGKTSSVRITDIRSSIICRLSSNVSQPSRRSILLPGTRLTRWTNNSG